MRAFFVCGVVLVAGCMPDSGGLDSGADPDSGVDAGAVDAGIDAGAIDAGVDAGTPDAGSATPFGGPCRVSPDAGCEAGLLCLEGPGGGGRGFCTKTCPASSSGACAGTPVGAAAYCVVTNVNTAGDKGCAFFCALGSATYVCPGTLICQPQEDPPGSGQKLCLP